MKQPISRRSPRARSARSESLLRGQAFASLSLYQALELNPLCAGFWVLKYNQA